MFNKLLSNLPFNPSLIHQVSFYTKRLRKEAAIRRVGFLFIALTMVLQIVAINTPAEASCDAANNDIIRCGFGSRDQALRHCQSNTQGFGAMLQHYGVGCDAVGGAATVSIRSTDNNRQLFSAGRRQYGKPSEYPVTIPGAGTIYWRPLWSWDSAGPSTYQALRMQAGNGATVYILYSCGNLVIDQSRPPEPKKEAPPQLRVGKVNDPVGQVKPGDTITYTIAFTNTGGTAAFFSVKDTFPAELDFVGSQHGNWIFNRSGNSMQWANNTPPFYTFGNTDALGTPGFIKVTGRVKASVANGTKICNKAWVEDVNVDTKKVRKWNEVTVCNQVGITCPPGQILENNKCVKPPEQPKTPLISQSKKAKNITQNLADATTKAANAGDVIEYSLTTTNSGSGDAKNYQLLPEDLTDVLQYAVLDTTSLNGGTFDPQANSLSWRNKVTIKANQSITKTFRVKIKDPIPETVTPNSNPGSYDMILTNVYGNTINIPLPKSVPKITEQTAKSLPNTGPGTNIAIGFSLTVVIGYFFARSRLLTQELEIVKSEYTGGGSA